MATRIRLRRVGRSKQASFRIVVAGSMHSRSGRITEAIGKYNPRTQPSYIEVDEVRALYWLRQGAEVSESVRPLFRQAGILRKFAEGAEGAGVVTIGDPQGKTNPVRAAQVAPAPEEEKVKEAPAKKAKAAAPEAEAKAPEAEAEAKAPKAEPGDDAVKEREGAKAEAPAAEPEVKGKKAKAKPEEKAEPEAKAEPVAEAKAEKPKKAKAAKKAEAGADKEKGEES